jgi:hypothetical protein
MPDTGPLAAELAAIRRRAEQITSSHGDPGEEDSCDLNGETCTGHDAERLLAAVEAVLALHSPFRDADCSDCLDAYGEHLEWPCPTSLAVSRALLGEETGRG